MSWEFVAQFVLVMFMATVFVILIMAVGSALADSKAKREIEKHKAGLPPKGHKHSE